MDVYFQTNTWTDTPFCVKWVDNTLRKTVQEEQEPFVLFCGNLEGQKAEVFKESADALGGIVWYGVANVTDIWRSIDAGYARLLKVLIKQEFSNWLDYKDNIDKWYEETVFSASEKRILITRWVGKAYRKICDPKYDHLRYRLFEKAGTLITADGSDDDKIQPEGLPNYNVQPPSVIDASPAPPVSGSSNEKEGDPEETVADDFEGENENEFELLQEQEEGVQSLFSLFERELL